MKPTVPNPLPSPTAEREITTLQRMPSRERGDAGVPPELNPGQRKIIESMQNQDRKMQR